jgi:hypothetical protein
VVITAPQDVADEMRAHVEKLLKSCK